METERRTTLSEAQIEFRDGEKPTISGYAAVFSSESRNLGGFVETIHPNAFDDVLAAGPDVIGVFNHDRNLLLGRTSNGTMRLMKDAYGLRYEITPNVNTSVGRDVVEWVKDRTVVGSSFAFAISKDGNGDSWSTDERGMRRREVRKVALLEDCGPVTRPAYDASSVVVSRRAIEMALGENYRPTQTMANAAKRGLKLAAKSDAVDQRLVCIAERIASRDVLAVEEVEYATGVFQRCLAAKETGWSGTPAWIEWQLAGGESGQKWIARKMPEPQEERAVGDVSLVPTAGMAAAAKRGLALHEAGRSGDGLKPETVSRAKRIAARDALTPEHVREMRAWFRRHKVDKKAGWSKAGEETPGYTAWQLWGGDAAWRWSEMKVGQMERESGQRDLPDDGDSEAGENYPAGLTARDLATAEAYEAIAEDMGEWPQDAAHYMTANPFADKGIKCGNCVFFESEEGRCYVVQGEIQAGAVCKLWIIPGDKMSEEKPVEEPRSEQPAIDVESKVAELKASLLRTQLHGGGAGK
jgi:HK97 family phage prohead protease